MDFQAQPDFLRIEKFPHDIILLQYITAVRTQKEPNRQRTFKVREPRRKTEAPGKILHLNCLRRRGDSQGQQCMAQNTFSTGLIQLCFLLKVRDCHNPTVVLVPLGNSLTN